MKKKYLAANIQFENAHKKNMSRFYIKKNQEVLKWICNKCFINQQKHQLFDENACT